MNEEFENFNDQDEEWLTELEIRASDLENELFDWREAHARELADTGHGRDAAARQAREARTSGVRAQPRNTPSRRVPPPGIQPGEAMHHVIEDEDLDQDEDDLTPITRASWPRAASGGPSPRERTQTLIDRGRRSAGRARRSPPRKIVLGVIGLAVVVAIAAVILLRPNPSWPPAWPPSRAR